MLLGSFSFPERERTQKRMRRKGSEVVTRLCTIAILAALGFVLMSYARIPYPPAPWLMIEFSEVTVIIAYALYSWSGALTVSIIKVLLDLAVHGLTDPFGIGHITAFLTSILYVLCLFLCSHVFRWFRKGKIGYRILSYLFLMVLVSLTMTFLNGLFITPSYVTAYGNPAHLSTCFDEEALNGALSTLAKGLKTEGSGMGAYWGMIFLAYFPFNLLKSGGCALIYELLFQRAIFVLKDRSPFFRKYFMGSVFKPKEKEATAKVTKEENSSEGKEEKSELSSTATSAGNLCADNKEKK